MKKNTQQCSIYYYLYIIINMSAEPLYMCVCLLFIFLRSSCHLVRVAARGTVCVQVTSCMESVADGSSDTGTGMASLSSDAAFILKLCHISHNCVYSFTTACGV